MCNSWNNLQVFGNQGLQGSDVQLLLHPEQILLLDGNLLEEGLVLVGIDTTRSEEVNI
ncbi:MAG: hypothetical protein K0T99_02130 [Alphaproteobacteria bacterium]|nr:hypothetical protein [Alphaproteobacteria bacterium]